MRDVRPAILMSILWAGALHPVRPSAGQEAAPSGQDQRATADAARQLFQAHAREEAAAYDLRVGTATGRKLMLQARPILTWTNPVPEKQMHGDVFLWTDDGRPAAVLCLFEMTEGTAPREYHEFCSLAAEGLVTVGDPDRKWSPATAQLTMSPLPDAPPPALAPRQRLSQMRELAARFACEKTTRTGEKHTLRLLSQPVARYESPTQDVTDGALFVFAEATDPEVFLLLEARSAGGTLQWQYGLARMVSVRVQVSFADKTVWEVDTLPYEEYRNRPDKPYTLLAR
jgi:hypothetical protein